MKMKKVISAFVLICVLVSVLCGCSLLSAKSGSDKEFSGEGLTITLTDNFRTAEIEGYTLCYDSFDVAVYALKENFEVFENAGLDNVTLDDYKGYVLKANSKYSPKEDNFFDGLTVLRYESYIEAKKTNFTYFVSLYKGTDAFWIVQFACKSSEYADYEQYFVKWARSVRV